MSVTERVQVKHGGRILLGNNHLYRLSCPHTVEQSGEENELMDYEQAMKEISINELTNGGSILVGWTDLMHKFVLDPVYSKVQENLMKKHEEEKEGEARSLHVHMDHPRWSSAGALAAQRLKYEEQLAKLKEQLESSNVAPAAAPKLKYTT